MDLEFILEVGLNKVEVYFVPEYAARFNRKSFPRQGYYILTHKPNQIKGTWSGCFNRLTDAESSATTYLKKAA